MRRTVGLVGLLAACAGTTPTDPPQVETDWPGCLAFEDASVELKGFHEAADVSLRVASACDAPVEIKTIEAGFLEEGFDVGALSTTLMAGDEAVVPITFTTPPIA